MFRISPYIDSADNLKDNHWFSRNRNIITIPHVISETKINNNSAYMQHALCTTQIDLPRIGFILFRKLQVSYHFTAFPRPAFVYLLEKL